VRAIKIPTLWVSRRAEILSRGSDPESRRLEGGCVDRINVGVQSGLSSASTTGILRRGDCLEVHRIYAPSMPTRPSGTGQIIGVACMVNMQANGDRAKEPLVRPPMRRHLTTVDSEPAVPGSLDASLPFQTAGLTSTDQAPESLIGRAEIEPAVLLEESGPTWYTPSPLTRVVHVTKALNVGRLSASVDGALMYSHDSIPNRLQWGDHSMVSPAFVVSGAPPTSVYWSGAAIDRALLYGLGSGFLSCVVPTAGRVPFWTVTPCLNRQTTSGAQGAHRFRRQRSKRSTGSPLGVMGGTPPSGLGRQDTSVHRAKYGALRFTNQFGGTWISGCLPARVVGPAPASPPRGFVAAGYRADLGWLVVPLIIQATRVPRSLEFLATLKSGVVRGAQSPGGTRSVAPRDGTGRLTDCRFLPQGIGHGPGRCHVAGSLVPSILSLRRAA